MSLFSKLVYNFDAEEWNEYDLPKLSLREIQVLCRLLGSPKSGSKEKVIARLLAVRQVRLKLSRFQDDPHAIVPEFRKEALKHMAREAGLWRSGNKIQLATVLLNWRNKCRHDGQKFFEDISAELAKRPQQLAFF